MLGEVHTFDYSKVSTSSKWTSMTLERHAFFVLKTEIRCSGASFVLAVRISALGPVLEDDRGLCPVRALKVYLARTQDLRGCDLLFISYKTGHKDDIHMNDISSWTRKLLHFAYSSAPEDVIRLSRMLWHLPCPLEGTFNWKRT